MIHLQIKRKWKALCFLASSFSLVSTSAQAVNIFRAVPRAQCTQGIESFKKNVHTLIRNECKRCHDTGSKWPAHAVENVDISYSFIMSYVNWKNIGESKIVKKVGENHWLAHPQIPGPNPKVNEEDIKKALELWWQEGQKECPTFGNFVSKPQELPLELANWTTVKVPLPSESDSLKNGSFSFEIKKEKEEFWMRKPQVEGISSSVRLKNVYLVLNGQVFDSPFNLIQGSVGMGAATGSSVLSSFTTILPVLHKEANNLALGFEVLKPVVKPDCQNLEVFRKDIAPVLELRSCNSCHQGSEDPKAKARFNLEGEEKDVCRTVLERGNGKYTVESPLISYPLRGVNDHPVTIPNQGEILPYWVRWIKGEKVHEF